MQFVFGSAGRILFGPGTISQAADAASAWGKRPFLVGDPGLISLFLERFPFLKKSCASYPVLAEPDVDSVAAAVLQAREAGCDVVIGIGGGSSLDTAKAVSGLLANPGEILDFLEVVGKGLPLSRAAAPCILVPTTAGTGAEVTCNAVIASPAHEAKVSLRSPFLFARLAVVDPWFTHSMPPDLTASTGLDALTQLIEAFVCRTASPLSDGFCREGLKRAGQSYIKAWKDGSDAGAREGMALASLLSGMALSNAGLGAVHGMAGPLGGMVPVPHGVACARLLAPVMAANLNAIRRPKAESPVLDRYDEIARDLTKLPSARAEQGITWIKDRVEETGIPPLSQYGFGRERFPDLIRKAKNASSMKANPVVFSDEELKRILEAACP